MKTKRSKGFYITLWSFGILLTFLIGAYGATYVQNSQGIFVDGNRSFARTADVVVCRGQNTLDDVVKTFQCDVVCLSTDSDCGDDINNINTDGSIFFRKGFYNIGTSITLNSNMDFIFEEGSILNNSNPTFQLFRQGSFSALKSNVSIYGGEFNCQGKGCWYTSGNWSDIKIKNAIFNQGNSSKGSSGIEIFFDAYAPYYYIEFKDNIIQGNSSQYDMVGSGLIYYSDFSHNIFRNGDGQGIGVNVAVGTKYNDNTFYSVGNAIGMEGYNNTGNIINNNILWYSGNIKLSLIGTDSSNNNIVSNNQLYYSQGIEAYNSYSELITGNIIKYSQKRGIVGCMKDSIISNNLLYDTNDNNQVETWNGTSITAGGILIVDCPRWSSPSGNRILSNTLVREDTSFNTGGIAIGNLVINTQIIDNKMLNNFGGYQIAQASLIDNFQYNQTNPFAQIPSCGSNPTTSITYGQTIKIFNNTGTYLGTCIGGVWKYQTLT